VDDLISQFTGISSIATESDESANGTSSLDEPNLIWGGVPSQRLLELYDHTARAVKAVNQKLRAGPGKAQAAWADLSFNIAQKMCRRLRLGHVYGKDRRRHFRHHRTFRVTRWSARAVKKVHDRSRHPHAASTDLERIQRQLLQTSPPSPMPLNIVASVEGRIPSASAWRHVRASVTAARLK